jgi:hypothetical protein
MIEYSRFKNEPLRAIINRNNRIMVPLKRYVPWGLALFFGVLYLLTPTALYYWDGVVFAYLCERGSPSELFHPHHLLYNLLTDIAYEFFHMHFPNLRSITFLAWVSSIFGALTIYFSHLIYRKIFNREGLAVTTTSFTGFAFTFWHYSTDANAYIISAFFPILAAYLMIYMDDFPGHKARMIWIAVCFSIGMLLHQVVVFFYPVYILWVIIFRFRDPNRKFYPLQKIVLLFLPALITGIVYFIVGRVIYHFTLSSEYWEWITAYGRQSKWWFSTEHSGFAAFLKAIGVSHLQLMFYPSYIRHGLLDFSNITFTDLIKKFLALVSILTIMLVFIRGIIYVIGAVGRRRFYAALLIAWITPYFIFFTFFTPQFEFYRLYYLCPLMVIFALGLKGFFEKPSFEHLDLPIQPNKLSGWVFVLLTIFAIYNYGFGIRPQMREENNRWLTDAKAFIASTPEDSIMVVPFSEEKMEEYSRGANLVNYFGRQGILFAEQHVVFVGPIEEFVGPIVPLPPDETDEELPQLWADTELKPGLFADIEKAYFHADMLDGRQDGWDIFAYRFPNTKVYLKEQVRLPLKKDSELVRIGSIEYHKGKKWYLYYRQ